MASEAEDESREKIPQYQRRASLRHVQPGYPEYLALVAYSRKNASLDILATLLGHGTAVR